MLPELLLSFRIIEAVIGIGVAYVAGRTYLQNHNRGWRFLGFSGVTMTAWALGSLAAHVIGSEIGYVIDGVGLPLFAFFLSVSVMIFVTKHLPVELPYIVTLQTALLYLSWVFGVTIVLGLVLYEFPRPFFTFMYSATLLLILPAIYGFHKIPEAVRATNWRYFVVSSILIYIAVLSNLYATAFCGEGGPAATTAMCSEYVYDFAMIHNLPLSDPLLSAALIAPVLMLAATVTYGAGMGMIYYHMHRRTDTGKAAEGEEIEHLVQSSADVIGDIIGQQLAERIAASALEDFPDITGELADTGLDVAVLESVKTQDTFDTVAEALAEAYGGVIGEVGRRKVHEVAADVREHRS